MRIFTMLGNIPIPCWGRKREPGTASHNSSCLRGGSRNALIYVTHAQTCVNLSSLSTESSHHDPESAYSILHKAKVPRKLRSNIGWPNEYPSFIFAIFISHSANILEKVKSNLEFSFLTIENLAIKKPLSEHSSFKIATVIYLIRQRTWAGMTSSDLLFVSS